MARPKRRNQEDHDMPAAKKHKTNTTFTLNDFMDDFPLMEENIVNDISSPLPSTVLEPEELQDLAQRKPPLRSTFNLKLPPRLNVIMAEDAPYEWMKNQYSHCVIPELGEEYDFDYDSETFNCLRDLHNARVRIRDEEFLPDYIVCSLATRWISLEEKDRPASDGCFANGEIFVANCLPIDANEDALEKYFEEDYPIERAAQHYIPRSKYSVHFVGLPQLNEDREIQSVKVGSVLIRNSRSGDVVHIDTGAINSREDRARSAGQVLKSWLEFQKRKCPKADLGPISDSEPLVLDVDRETHPTLRSLHALVSASLFLRRRITNWGDVTAFQQRGQGYSPKMANFALQNISGWLGLKCLAKNGERRSKKTAKGVHSFQDNYSRGGLLGREQPAPVSHRIFSAQKGEPPVYNGEANLDDDASDNGGSRASSRLSSHESDSSDEDTVIADQPKNHYELPDSSSSESEDGNDDEPVDKAPESIKKVSFEEPNNDKPNDEEPNNEELNNKGPTGEDLTAEKSNTNGEADGNDDDHNSSASA